MSEQIIKDARGRTIGFIRTHANGRQDALNADRQYAGYYDARNDVTKDRAGASKGNAVSGLITKFFGH